MWAWHFSSSVVWSVLTILCAMNDLALSNNPSSQIPHRCMSQNPSNLQRQRGNPPVKFETHIFEK